MPYRADRDEAVRKVALGGRPAPLVAMEYRMLAELSANAGQALTYEPLLERVWGGKSSGDVRSIRNMASKLRRKLGEDGDNPTYIFTEPRIGYRMPKGEIASGNRPHLPNSRWDGEQGLTTGLEGASP